MTRENVKHVMDCGCLAPDYIVALGQASDGPCGDKRNYGEKRRERSNGERKFCAEREIL